MQDTTAIEFLSFEWIRNFSITILLIFIYFFTLSKINKKNVINLLKASGLIVLFFTAINHILLIYSGNWSIKGEHLPLHLCSVSALICCVIFFIEKKQFLFEFLFYCGIIGGIISIMTPQITIYNDNYFYYFMFYFKHASIISIPFAMMYFQDMKLTKYSWLKTFGGLQILLIIVTPINNIIGSNYMYVAKPPIAKNPLILGTGKETILGLPDYVFGFEIILLLFLLLFYFIFKPRKTT